MANNASKDTLIFGVPKLPMKALVVVIPFMVSFIMSGVISFVSMVRSLGLGFHVFSPWVSVWMFSWMIAFPTILVVLPLARKMAMKLVKLPPQVK